MVNPKQVESRELLSGPQVGLAVAWESSGLGGAARALNDGYAGALVGGFTAPLACWLRRRWAWGHALAHVHVHAHVHTCYMPCYMLHAHDMCMHMCMCMLWLTLDCGQGRTKGRVVQRVGVVAALGDVGLAVELLLAWLWG